eukprot:g17824.t1
MILCHFRHLQSDPTNKDTFPCPPLSAFRMDHCLRNSLIRSTLPTSPTTPSTFPCNCIVNHFNSPCHSLGNMSILGLLQCHNDATWKLEEQHLIFHLRSLQPNGLNVDFTSFKI